MVFHFHMWLLLGRWFKPWKVKLRQSLSSEPLQLHGSPGPWLDWPFKFCYKLHWKSSEIPGFLDPSPCLTHLHIHIVSCSGLTWIFHARLCRILNSPIQGIVLGYMYHCFYILILMNKLKRELKMKLYIYILLYSDFIMS